MHRISTAIAGVFILAFASSAVFAQPEKKLNVLFLCVDDLRPNLGCYGDSIAYTPNIDRLAANGITFDRAYSQQALCAPSRASVMTGRRPDALKISSGDMHFRQTLPDVITLPQFFKQNGYFTQAFGKVYHVHPPQPDPVSWSVPEQLLDIPKRDEYLMPTNRVRGFINRMEKGTATESVDAPDNAYQDGQVAQAAIEALQAIGDRPFFLAVGFKRPHLPFTAPKKYWDIYDRDKLPIASDTTAHNCTPEQAALRYDWQVSSGEMRNYTDIPSSGPIAPDKSLELIHGYYACTSYIDAQVGRVLKELDRLSLTEKTIVIFWSDHGFHLGEKGLWGKKDNTEFATRVPLILSVPGKKKNIRTNALVELVDIYPTLVEFSQLPMPVGLEGTSMAPLLHRPDVRWKKAVFSQYPRKNSTVMGYSVRTDRFRYNEHRIVQSGYIVDRELYRINDDPYEKDNVVGRTEYSDEIRDLKKLLDGGWKRALPK